MLATFETPLFLLDWPWIESLERVLVFHRASFTINIDKSKWFHARSLIKSMEIIALSVGTVSADSTDLPSLICSRMYILNEQKDAINNRIYRILAHHLKGLLQNLHFDSENFSHLCPFRHPVSVDAMNVITWVFCQKLIRRNRKLCKSNRPLRRRQIT